MPLAIALLALISVSACRATETLQLAFVVDRRQNLEPCGCSFNPMGGSERQQVLLTRWRESFPELVYVEAGTVFFDGPSTDSSASMKVVEALNAFHTKAVGLSAEDLSLGEARLKTLRAAAKFPFLATNLSSKPRQAPPFDEFVALTGAGGSRRLVVGFVVKEGSPPIPIEFSVEPPSVSLKRVIDKVGADVDIIVLGNLGIDEKRTLAKAFPRIVLFVGGDAKSPPHEIERLVPTTLTVKPESGDRGVSLVELELGVRSEFFDPVGREEQERYAGRLEEALRRDFYSDEKRERRRKRDLTALLEKTKRNLFPVPRAFRRYRETHEALGRDYAISR